MNKMLLMIIILIIIVSTAVAINNYDEKITKPQIDINININDNKGVYTITVNDIECVHKHPIKLDVINYELTNITDITDIQNVNMFTFSVSNSTQQKYKNTNIELDFVLYGSGCIINKKGVK